MVRGEVLREAARTLAVGAACVVFFLALAAAVPWVGFQDDMQTQYIGGFREVARALARHELPILSLHSWNAGALAGEYQYGVFSVFILAIDALAWKLASSPAAVAHVLVATHVAVLACGSFRLARALALASPLAAFVALVATLDGWTFAWGTTWFPSLASFAWVPWLAWTLAGRGASRAVGAALFTYLVVAAGWPHTDAMLVVVVAWMTVRELGGDHRRARRRLVTALAACGLGVLLAAPAWMCLREHAAETLRPRGGVDRSWVLPVSALPSAAFPAFVGFWQTWIGWSPRPALELSDGALPVALVAAATLGARRAFIRAARWELALAGICLLLAALPSIYPTRYSFRWLPLAHLALALAAARAGEVLAAGEAANTRIARALRNPGVLGLVFACVVALDGLRTGLSPLDKTATLAVAWLSVLFIVAVAWARASRRVVDWVVCFAVPVLQASAFLVVDTRDVACWDVDERTLDPAPLDPARVYLGMQWEYDQAPPGGVGERDATLRPSNVPMLAGLTFVNGYSPLKPREINAVFPFDVHGNLPPQAARAMLKEPIQPGGVLDELGVDGIVVSRELARIVEVDVPAAMKNAGWVLRTSLPAGDVYERPAPPRATAWTIASPDLAPVAMKLVDERTLRVDLDVVNRDTSRPGLVVLRRAYYPGYKATWNGAEVPIEPLQGVLVAVRIPAGASGRLGVAYAPRGVTVGFPLAGVAALLVLLLAWRARRIEEPA